MEWIENERVLILGGSRGLGAALRQQLEAKSIQTFSISRRSEIRADFSRIDSWAEVFRAIADIAPRRIIYCAGGGPYGKFSKFEWKDHQWALRVTFEFPAYLLHSLLRNPWLQLEQVIIIGSAVAGSRPDKNAAAYCAAKHALKGLIFTLQEEGTDFDLRLLSPGYMETDMLPPHSGPRQLGIANKPEPVAQLMIQSISDPALRSHNQSFD